MSGERPPQEFKLPAPEEAVEELRPQLRSGQSWFRLYMMVGRLKSDLPLSKNPPKVDVEYTFGCVACFNLFQAVQIAKTKFKLRALPKEVDSAGNVVTNQHFNAKLIHAKQVGEMEMLLDLQELKRRELYRQ